MINDYIIRPVTPDDIISLIGLCAEHAAYEESLYNRENKVSTLSKAIFSEPPKLFCLVIEYYNELVGYATYMKQYSTWDAAEYLYMDCLFLTSVTRGKGIGKLLMEHLYVEAEKLGCSLLQWQTPDFNTRAIKFYYRLGATSKDKIRFFKELQPK